MDKSLGVGGMNALCVSGSQSLKLLNYSLTHWVQGVSSEELVPGGRLIIQPDDESDCVMLDASENASHTEWEL